MPSRVPTPLVLCHNMIVKEGQLFSKGGLTIQLHRHDTTNAGHVFASRHTSIPQTCCFQISWNVCGWWNVGGSHSGGPVRVPFVVTNGSLEAIMWVCSVRLISYSRFLLYNMSQLEEINAFSGHRHIRTNGISIL